MGQLTVPDPLVLVPARGGSKRLPRKNIRPLAGLSLLGWTMRAIKEAGLERPMLSTDDAEIAAAGRDLGFWLPFLRPVELAGDDITTLPVVLHALDWCAAEFGSEPKLIVLLQPTSPFRSAALLTEALDRMATSPAAEALIAVKRLHVTAGAVYTVDGAGLAPLAGRDDARPAYVPSGALYVARSEALRRHGSFVPPGCLHLEHDGISALDIDTREDWALAEAAIKLRREEVGAMRS